MTLEPGTRLGPYEIVSLRGKGGMGEVYLARDTRLDRKVAIKVSRELAQDPSLRQRLQREARTISQLRHPHLCALYDVGSEQGLDFLVMEYLEGETLDDRLSRGALPLDEAIALGIQIAEGVAAAHRGGVVHRDLKPGNVMLTRDGAKVLDFGLAKGLETRAAGGGSQSPTITQHALTAAGSLIGTLLYMAPEQLEGKEADERSDVWALGAVLYQMVTGARPFNGESQASVMAAIMTGRPRPLSELQPSAPARLGWLIERCLEKSPDRRWQSAGDLALELSAIGEASETTLPGASGGRRPRSIVLALGAMVVLLAGLGIGLLLSSRAGGGVGMKEPEQWTTMLLDSTESRKSAFEGVDITPDGRTVLVFKREGGESRIHRRTLDSLRTQPFVVPPGQHLAGRPNDRLWPIIDPGYTLRTMPIEGGEPGPVLAEKVWSVGAWGEDGYVYYYTNDFLTEPGVSFAAESHIATWRVKVSGGEPEPLADGYPTDLLPGNRILLTTVARQQPDFRGAVMAVDLATRKSRFLVTGVNARYLDPGFLVFCRHGALWAAPIDPSTGELSAPARAIEQVLTGPAGSLEVCAFGLSRSGNLVYAVPRAGTGLGRLVWVARDGTVEPVTDEIEDFTAPILSLDGQQVSIAVRLPDGRFEQRTFDLSSSSWSRPDQRGSTGAKLWVPPDERDILFRSDRFEERSQIFVQPADLSRPPERLLPSEQAQGVLGVSADGQQVMLINFGAPGFFVLDRGSRKVRTVIEDGTVLSADFNRDGDWIVYGRSDDKGNRNIWLVPFPGPGEPRQITFDDDSEEPIWSVGGDEIYYRGPTHIMAMPVQKSGNDLKFGKARPLFEDHFRRHPDLRGIQSYRPHSDGRLLMIEPAETGEQSAVLVLNWRAKVVQAFADGDGS